MGIEWAEKGFSANTKKAWARGSYLAAQTVAAILKVLYILMAQLQEQNSHLWLFFKTK